MSFLDIGELYQPLKKERHEKLKTFQKILGMCHLKIKTVAHQSREQECLLDIPNFIPGTPPYDLKELIMYLKDQLSKNGLLVIVTPPNHIYVSWKPNDIDYAQYQQRLSEHRHLQQLREQEVLAKQKEKREAIERELKEFQTPSKGKGGREGLNHVAMIGYNDEIDDLVPVNRHKLRAVKERTARVVKPGFKGPAKSSVYPFNPI